MIEKIFQGFIEWIYGMILEFWEYFSSALLDVLSVDFAYLQARIPILPTIQQAVLAVGWALLLGNLVFQATRGMMSGLGFEGEDPKLLFTRTFVFSFLLLASPQICGVCLNMTSTVIGIMEIPNVVNISLVEATAFDGLPCAWLVAIICGVIVMFQSFRLIFALVERYFILAVLTICAPLAFGVGGSKNTSDIFTGWCRMYGSMCLLMILNVVFVKMLLSVLASAPSGVNVLLWVVLVISIVKVARKADDIITRMGLNPAITSNQGRGIAGMLTYAIARTVLQQVIKTAGSRPKGPTGSPHNRWSPGTAAPSGRTNPGQKQLGYISSVLGQPSSGGKEAGLIPSPGQKDTVTSVGGGERVDSKKYSSETSDRHTASRSSAASVTRETRKTAVPPGTRRSPVHGAGSTSVRAGAGASGSVTTRESHSNIRGRNRTENINPIKRSSQAPAIPLGPGGKQPKGQERSSQTPQRPGTAGTARAGGDIKLTQASTQSLHDDHFKSAMQSEKHSSSKASGSQIKPSFTTTGDKANKTAGTRSTRRPADAITTAQRGQTHLSSSISESKVETSRSGTAGATSPGASRQSKRAAKSEGQSAQPKGTQPIQAPAPSPTRQEGRPDSPGRFSGKKADSSSVRPGTAGTGPAMPTRQTSRAPRQGRDAANPVMQQAIQTEQPSTARQESRLNSQGGPSTQKTGAHDVRPGTAGTATKLPSEVTKPKSAQSGASGAKGKSVLKGSKIKTPSGGKLKKSRSTKVQKSPPGGEEDV